MIFVIALVLLRFTTVVRVEKPHSVAFGGYSNTFVA